MSGPVPRWEHFGHEADIGVHGVGRNPGEAFAQAALALTAVVTEPTAVAPDEAVAIECAAPDIELLLVDWLNAIIYEMAVRHMLFSRFDVHITDGRLSARLFGQQVDPARHQPAVEVKGATCTALSVREDDHGVWHARCVIDV